MIRDIQYYLAQWEFWARVTGGLVVWYLVSLAISRGILNGGAKPLSAARQGVWWSLAITIILAFAGVWVIWANLKLAMVVTLVLLVLLLALILALTLLEPQASE